jgi:hypothetical protein
LRVVELLADLRFVRHGLVIFQLVFVLVLFVILVLLTPFVQIVRGE